MEIGRPAIGATLVACFVALLAVRIAAGFVWRHRPGSLIAASLAFVRSSAGVWDHPATGNLALREVHCDERQPARCRRVLSEHALAPFFQHFQ